MLNTIELVDPDGTSVLVSPEAALILREKGYTDPLVVHDVADDEQGDDSGAGSDDGDGAGDGDANTGEGTDGEPDVKDPAAPRGNASRADWAAYADQVGLQVADEDSREDIKAAVAELEQ